MLRHLITCADRQVHDIYQDRLHLAVAPIPYPPPYTALGGCAPNPTTTIFQEVVTQHYYSISCTLECFETTYPHVTLSRESREFPRRVLERVLLRSRMLNALSNQCTICSTIKRLADVATLWRNLTNPRRRHRKKCPPILKH